MVHGKCGLESFRFGSYLDRVYRVAWSRKRWRWWKRPGVPQTGRKIRVDWVEEIGEWGGGWHKPFQNGIHLDRGWFDRFGLWGVQSILIKFAREGR